MALKDKIDRRTGYKLRRLTAEESRIADRVFDAMRSERELTKLSDIQPDATADCNRHSGPARLASPFAGLNL